MLCRKQVKLSLPNLAYWQYLGGLGFGQGILILVAVKEMDLSYCDKEFRSIIVYSYEPLSELLREAVYKGLYIQGTTIRDIKGDTRSLDPKP